MKKLRIRENGVSQSRRENKLLFKAMCLGHLTYVCHCYNPFPGLPVSKAVSCMHPHLVGIHPHFTGEQTSLEMLQNVTKSIQLVRKSQV